MGPLVEKLVETLIPAAFLWIVGTVAWRVSGGAAWLKEVGDRREAERKPVACPACQRDVPQWFIDRETPLGKLRYPLVNEAFGCGVCSGKAARYPRLGESKRAFERATARRVGP